MQRSHTQFRPHRNTFAYTIKRCLLRHQLQLTRALPCNRERNAAGIPTNLQIIGGREIIKGDQEIIIGGREMIFGGWEIILGCH